MSRRKSSILLILALILTFVLTVPPQVRALTPSFAAQSSGCPAGTNTAATSGSISVTKNQGLIIFATVGLSTTTVSDTGGNTWTMAISSGGAYQFRVYTATAAATVSITVTASGLASSNHACVFILAYNNVGGFGALANEQWGISQLPPESLAITTTTANSVIVGASQVLTCSGGTITASAGQTQRILATDGSNSPNDAEDLPAATVGAYNHSVNWTVCGSTNGNHSAIEVKPSLDPPTISSISPTSGTNGAAITITGTFLTGATKITFCGDNQAVFTVVSSTSITTFAPNRNPLAGGETCDILVTTSAGTSATVTGDQFSYSPASQLNGYAGVPSNVYVWLTAIGIITVAIVAFLLVNGRRKQ